VRRRVVLYVLLVILSDCLCDSTFLRVALLRRRNPACLRADPQFVALPHREPLPVVA
jgi:hypothetical protein